MTTYDTTTLATAIIGEDAVTTNRKQATRTLRKFLRTDFKAREMQTPGKGGRYSIDLNKRDLNAMVKRFNAWKAAEEKAAEARKAALEAAKIENKAINAAEAKTIADDTATPDDGIISEDEIEGPSDAEIAEMLDELDAEGDDA